MKFTKETMNEVIEKIKNDKIINLIKANANNAEIFLVGGAVRDFILNSENFDKDIIVENVSAKVFAQNLAKAIDATFVALDEENKIYRLVLEDRINFIDIASPIGKNIEEDLKRRDLTINAIAINLNSFEILDYTGGIQDVKDRKIQHIQEANFVDDPLRLLRVFRFQATLGFKIAPELLKIVEKHAAKIQKSAVERINYELLKLFSGDYTVESLLAMDKTGLLKEILPICEELKTVPTNLHHHLDLFNHSIEVVNQVQIIYEKSSKEIREHLDRTDFGGASRLAHLKLAGLLHDIGKPSTWTIEEGTGKHRFIKHDDIGSKMGAKILKNAKFSKKQIDYVTKMLKYHIYPSNVVSAPEINEKIYMRFIRKMENDVIDVIVLAMSDRLSARGVEITDEIVNNNINNLQKLLDFYLGIKDNLKPLPKLLSGNEIMDLLNLEPSKKLGNIIAELKEAQLSGEICSREEAVAFILSKKQWQL